MVSRKSVLPDSQLVELVADGPRGTVLGRFSVFREIDSMGERTLPHSFDDAISHLKRNGIKLPFLYHHRTSDAQSIIGVVDELWTDKSGAWFKARLDLSNATAQRLYAIMSLNPAALGVSYGFGIPPGGSRTAKDGAVDLVKVFPLLEISLTPTPALDVARVEAVKSLGRSPTETENLLLSFEATAARGGFKSHDPLYVWDGLMSDPVMQWDAVEANITVKALDEVAGERCRCGKYITNSIQPPVVGGTVSWQACDGCGRLRAFIPAEKSEAFANHEMRIIRAKVRVEAIPDDTDHNRQMHASIDNAMKKQEVAALLKFAEPVATKTRTDYERDIASFDAVLTKKRDAVADFDSLFGNAPDIDPEEHV
jgi:HK97 family phage prohead protease